MTVKELITALQRYDDNMEVAIQYRDGGGFYDGTDNIYVEDWIIEDNTLIL